MRSLFLYPVRQALCYILLKCRDFLNDGYGRKIKLWVGKDIGIVALFFTLFISCQQPGANSTGSEFMPDMVHSVAYEANYYTYYYYNTWGSEDEYYHFATPRLPVKGTIPRGFAGFTDIDKAAGRQSLNGITYTPNGSVPYYYDDTESERARAIKELRDNPYAITEEGLQRGKDLYVIYCGICHGEKGDGSGYLVRDDGGKFLAQPANLILPAFIDTSNGLYYHSIMYGKNMMGDYKDKLSYEERWQVIHYIRSLQAKERKVEYNQITNTLNKRDIPAGEMAPEDGRYSDTNTKSHEEVGNHDSDHEEVQHEN